MIKTILHIPSPLRGLWLSILFTIICLCIYEWGLFRKEKLRRYLENKIEALTSEKRTEKKTLLELTEQIEAQNDPDWIELTLKKTLGATRVGETKFVFRIQE